VHVWIEGKFSKIKVTLSFCLKLTANPNMHLADTIIIDAMLVCWGYFVTALITLPYAALL
jgi:hypothetical protein